MDCGTSMAKYILFIFNTIVSIIGILGIVWGVLILQSIGSIKLNDAFPPQAILPLIIIVVCSVVVFISFLGCCGAIRESVCMTMSYAVCMLVLLILQLTIVVLLFTNKEKINEAMGEFVDKAWASDEANGGGIFIAIQKSMHCCGRNGAQDYALTVITKGLPESCCEGSCLNPANIYGGCRGKFMDLMSGSSDKAKYVGLGLIGVELVGFIFACCLANNVRNYKRRNGY